jgi:hypothetical protein
MSENIHQGWSGVATNLAKSSVEIRLRVKSMATALFADEIAHQISAKVGIRAEYIDVYPVRGGWDASLRPVTGIWTPAKSADVKQTESLAGNQQIRLTQVKAITETTMRADRETIELLAGSVGIILFGVALVMWQNL